MISTFSAAQTAATTTAAASAEANKLAEAAREALASVRSSYGVKSGDIDAARDDLSRKELRLRQSAQAADDAAAKLDAVVPVKAQLGKYDGATAAAVEAAEKFLEAALLAVEGLRPLLAAAQTAAAAAGAAYGQLPGAVRNALSLSPPVGILDGVALAPTPAELVRRCALLWEQRAFAASMANISATTKGGELPREFEVRVETFDLSKRPRSTERFWNSP